MLRCNEDKSRKLRFPLGAGDVLIMTGATQASAARFGSWLHTSASVLHPGSRASIFAHQSLAVVI